MIRCVGVQSIGLRVSIGEPAWVIARAAPIDLKSGARMNSCSEICKPPHPHPDELAQESDTRCDPHHTDRQIRIIISRDISVVSARIGHGPDHWFLLEVARCWKWRGPQPSCPPRDRRRHWRMYSPAPRCRPPFGVCERAASASASSISSTASTSTGAPHDLGGWSAMTKLEKLAVNRLPPLSRRQWNGLGQFRRRRHAICRSLCEE